MPNSRSNRSMRLTIGSKWSASGYKSTSSLQKSVIDLSHYSIPGAAVCSQESNNSSSSSLSSLSVSDLKRDSHQRDSHSFNPALPTSSASNYFIPGITGPARCLSTKLSAKSLLEASTKTSPNGLLPTGLKMIKNLCDCMSSSMNNDVGVQSVKKNVRNGNVQQEQLLENFPMTPRRETNCFIKGEESDEIIARLDLYATCADLRRVESSSLSPLRRKRSPTMRFHLSPRPSSRTRRHNAADSAQRKKRKDLGVAEALEQTKRDWEKIQALQDKLVRKQHNLKRKQEKALKKLHKMKDSETK